MSEKIRGVSRFRKSTFECKSSRKKERIDFRGAIIRKNNKRKFLR